MTDIRILEHYEASLLLPLAREFFSEGHIPGKLNEDHFVKTLETNTKSGVGITLVCGSPFRGTISGVMCCDLATADIQCMEYFWYVSKSERGSLGVRLLDAFEKEATSRGAKRILMMHHAQNDREKFEKLYEKRGYRLHEQMFLKDLT